MSSQTVMWAVFGILMIVMLAVDLGRNRTSHEVSFREALLWSSIWIALALVFNIGIYFMLGPQKALEFLAGYVIEKALSVDNLFVFLMIFSCFGVRNRHQARVLKWGIIGALIMRAVFIFAGIELLARFQWLFYVFGGILIVTAGKMAFGSEAEINPEKSLVVRTAKKLFPVTKRMYGDRFLIRKGGILAASPLLLVLLLVESSDLIFALDSIPAIFAVTLDPFIVFSSNIFAIMGLRSLYFLLANAMGMFAYLKIGVSGILAYVGVKMIAGVSGFHIPIGISLSLILAILVLAVAASILLERVRRLQAPECS